MIENLETINRPTLTAVNAKKEMVEASVTRDKVIELVKAFNALEVQLASLQTQLASLHEAVQTLQKLAARKVNPNTPKTDA